MKQTDWAKIYAAMDKRLRLKYEQLPTGEQIGKRKQSQPPQVQSPDTARRQSLPHR